MPNWSSQGEQQLDDEVLVKFTHALMGAYVWEWFLTIDFDWDVITRKKAFRWPIVFYFANRYLLLFALIGILISFDATTKINCQALFTFNQLAGNASLGLASINLSLRTLAIYGNSKILASILVLVILGHWTLILQAGTLLNVAWDNETGGCQIISTQNRVLVATFIYSMVLDLLVFLLTAYKLWFKRGKPGAMGESRLGRMLFGDGLVYFFIAFLSNCLATVFMLLNLNSVMNVIFNVPACIANTIVACRVVRRLSNFNYEQPEMFNFNTRPHSTIQGAQYRRSGIPLSPPIATQNRQMGSGVHVQMETYTHTEAHTVEPATPLSPLSPLSVRWEDTEMKSGQSDPYDVEAKAIAL